MLKFLITVIAFLLGYRYLKLLLTPKPKDSDVNSKTTQQSNFDDGEYIDYEEVE